MVEEAAAVEASDEAAEAAEEDAAAAERLRATTCINAKGAMRDAPSLQYTSSSRSAMARSTVELIMILPCSSSMAAHRESDFLRRLMRVARGIGGAPAGPLTHRVCFLSC